MHDTHTGEYTASVYGGGGGPRQKQIDNHFKHCYYYCTNLLLNKRNMYYNAIFLLICHREQRFCGLSFSPFFVPSIKSKQENNNNNNFQ